MTPCLSSDNGHNEQNFDKEFVHIPFRQLSFWFRSLVSNGDPVIGLCWA